MTTITIRLEDMSEVILTKIPGGLRMSERDSHLDIQIDLSTKLDAGYEEQIADDIASGNKPEFARFMTILQSQTEDVLSPFTETRMNEFEQHPETFERIAYELWKKDSRLVDRDQFIIGQTDVRCLTLGTSVDILSRLLWMHY